MSKVRENDGRWMDWVRAATNDGDCLHLSSAQGSLHIRQDNRITPSGLDIAKAKRCLLPTSHQDWCLDGCISVPFEHSYPHLAARLPAINANPADQFPRLLSRGPIEALRPPIWLTRRPRYFRGY